jgi:signal transduction histidine kinase
MLTLQDVKSLVKSINVREAEGRAASRKGPTVKGSSVSRERTALAGIESFMADVATNAGLDLVALIESDSRGKSASVIAAGQSGLTSVLAVPSLEDRGPLAKLIRDNRPRGGRGKVLTSNEVFPRDGKWCELVPMDSSVPYYYQPLAKLPVPGIEKHLRLEEGMMAGCLAIDESHDDSDASLKVRALLAASLVTNLRIRMSDEPREEGREERAELLRRLTSSIAHEIKNPLTGISAGVQYLAKKLQPGATEEETVDFILTEISRLNRIIDDLYSVSKPQTLIFVETDVPEVIKKSLLCLSEEVVKRGISTQVDVDESAPPIKADPDRLQQVFINVLKNAIEASAKGGRVEVVLECSSYNIIVEVRDEGCGIPSDDIDKIFEPFHSNKSGGTGLGLYLSREIVERHRGSIEVLPRKGKGTVFRITLPIRDARNG